MPGGTTAKGTRLLVLLTLTLSLSSGCKRREEIVVFHASSLRRALFEAARELERAHPGTRVRLEPSGSQIAARKVAELGLRADLVFVSDAEVIDQLLVPSHATWNVELATNEIALAHKDHSRFTDQITTDSWPDVLQREGVRLGRADPETAPLGYQTLFVWSLAERGATPHPDLSAQLVGRIAKEHVVADETELLGLLESRAIDYAFLYRSTAEDHHLKLTPLAPEQNLSRRELAERYGSVEIEIGSGARRTVQRGRPIVYAATIPSSAENPSGATRFLELLLTAPGRRIFERAGFRPLQPAPCRRAARVPEPLRALVTPTP